MTFQLTRRQNGDDAVFRDSPFPANQGRQTKRAGFPVVVVAGYACDDTVRSTAATASLTRFRCFANSGFIQLLSSADNHSRRSEQAYGQ
jgi:hypothetical protein